ncbi:hypothetical protein OFM21_34350, partial [Escherichia coli]|nr:hypothetical protein [Escherichia coli]
DGTASIVQPLINPIYDGHNIHEVVQLFFKENYDKRDYDIVREYWQRQGFGSSEQTGSSNFEDNWRRALHDGLVANSA